MLTWRLVLACLLSAGLVAPAAFAAEKKKKKGEAAPADEVVGETDEGKKIVRKTETVDEDSSEYHRQGKKGSAVAEIGFGVGAIPTSGIAGGYYYSANNLIEASYISGEVDVIFVKVKASLAELRLKHFFGNSFYTNLGLGYRTIGFGATLEPLTGNDEYEETLSVSSVGAAIGIGNRWQWENFTIGCDWIGQFFPLSKTGETKVKSSNVDEDDREDLENTAKDLGDTASGMLLRFYLGASF